MAFALLHWKGIGLTPDGWAYWQGAVSLSHGRGYTYLSGNPILEWPPLYPLYLSTWVLLLGPTGAGLVAANGVLVTIQAALWCWASTSMWRDTGSTASTTTRALVSVYLGLFVAVQQQAVLADALKYTLLPVLVLASWRASRSEHPKVTFRWGILASIVGILALLTHTNSVAFVASSAVLIAARRPLAGQRLVAAAVVAGVPVLVWFIVRQVLGQTDSHPIGLGNGRYGPGVYLLQLIHGAGALLTVDTAGAPLMAVAAVAVVAVVSVLKRRAGSEALEFSGSFAASSATITFALFNVTWVSDPLNGRVLLFAPLMLMPFVILTAARWRAAMAVATLVVTVLPIVYWTATWIRTNTSSSIEQLGFPEGFVPHRARVSSAYLEGPPLETPEGLLISPLGFEERGGGGK